VVYVLINGDMHGGQGISLQQEEELCASRAK
jgi:hypothetical protein